MQSMRTLRTQQHLDAWRRSVAQYSELRERIAEAGYLLVGLISRKAKWRTDAFFDILYGDPGSVLQRAAVTSLSSGLREMTFEDGTWNAGPRLSMTLQCVRTERFDVFAELVKRGPPPNSNVLDQRGSTTPEGAWMDTLSAYRTFAFTYPETMRVVSDHCEEWVRLLADVDPHHERAVAMHGTVAGAAFAELVMKRALDSSRVPAPAAVLVPAQPAARRSIGL